MTVGNEIKLDIIDCVSIRLKHPNTNMHVDSVQMSYYRQLQYLCKCGVHYIQTHNRHLSVLIITLFTFPTASPHVHMSLSDIMPSASRYNIPMMTHTRYLNAHL